MTARPDPITRIRAWARGPAPTLPPVLDRLAERWARAPARARLVAVAVGVVVAIAVAGRGAVRSPYGGPVTVVTAATDLPAGHVLTDADLVGTTWPASIAPADAAGVDDLVGGRLTVGLVAGAPITSRHVGPGGVGARLGPGRAAFPLPVPEGVEVVAGQAIDLLAGGLDGTGVRLAAGAVVLGTDGTTLWVDVSRDEAIGLAGAAALGQIVIAVLPPAD